MNFELSATNLQELEQIVTTLVADAKCACHIINPNKTRILMWKEIKNNQTTYYLKIGIQKFSSQEQIDRNGEIYWRYWTYEPKKTEENISQKEEVKKEIIDQTPTKSNPITKYQQRIEKTAAINHAKSNFNSSEQSESTSH